MQKACPECGAPLAPGSPHGLCPKCLLLGQIGPPTQPCELEAAGPASAVIPSSSLSLEKAGDRIGRYKLLQEIGEGGCGVVYMAEQEEPIRRKVALKVIKLGMDTKQVIARFEAERQALALMDHPNIAKVLEAGATDTGRPYFVMELVYGTKITNYCDQKQLSTRERLDLFVQVCQAIQHAHQKGIIHRDIKPSNILVTLRDGVPVPKVIDFGIAKATTDQRLTDKTLFTQFAMFVGTPAYMSPEQAEMSELGIDTRSDIYSLGILLYELLTSRTPFEAGELRRAGLDEIRRIIREQEPLRPSTRLSTMTAAALIDTAKQRHVEPSKLCSQIRGDLDWIVMKALEKDRRRRFETANGLAMDIQRHLNYEPVLARPPSRLYRVQKFVRRNKVIVGAAVTIAGVLVLALFGISVSTWQAFRARADAQAEARQLTAAQRLFYVANVNLIQHAWNQNNVGLVRQMLEETAALPERGFEWFYWQRQTHLELQTLRGHLRGVQAVAFSPDGQRVVTGSADGTAKVWETASGNELIQLKGHPGWITSVAFSPDGLRIITGSDDDTAKVWEAASGKEMFHLTDHGHRISSVAFSRDGRRIVTGSYDQTAIVWEAANGKKFVTLTGHTDQIKSATFSTDGQKIVTASKDGSAKVWDAVEGKELLRLEGHVKMVNSAAFSADGKRIVTGSDDQTAKVWEAVGGKELFHLKGHSGRITSVGFSPDGRRIVTASDDHTVKVWDAATGKEVFTLKGHSDRINSVAFSPDGQRIVSGSEDSTAKVWDASRAKGPLTLEEHTKRLWSAAFSPNGQRIVTGSEDHTAKVWDSTSGERLVTFAGHTDGVLAVAFSPDGQKIVTGSKDKTARVWDAASGLSADNNGVQLPTLEGHNSWISSVAFAPDGQSIVTGCDDRTAKVWGAAIGKKLLTFTGHKDRIWSAAFSPDSQRIVTGGEDQTAWVWLATNGNKLFPLEGHNDAIRSVAFSPDGQWILTGSQDGAARVWDAATGLSVDRNGKDLPVFKGHSLKINSVAWSPDSQRIITGSDDFTAKVWEAATGKEILTLNEHTAPVFAVAFSSDGRRIITASDDHTAKVWDAASAAEILSWRKQEQTAAKYLADRKAQQAAAVAHEHDLVAHDPGAIKEWLVLLPIPVQGEDGARALQEEQVVHESQLHPVADERIKIGQSELIWCRVEQEYYLLDFNRLAGAFTEWSVAYAVSYIQCEATQNGVLLKVGSDGQAKVYLNGKLVRQCVHRRSYVADEDAIEGLELKGGINVVVLKVVNGETAWKSSVRLTAADGSPLKGIKTTLTP